MVGWWFIDVPFAKNYQVLPHISKEKKPKPDLQLKRYQHVLKMVKQKTKQLKRTQTLLKKWTQKKKYYEKVLVAASKLET